MHHYECLSPVARKRCVIFTNLLRSSSSVGTVHVTVEMFFIEVHLRSSTLRTKRVAVPSRQRGFVTTDDGREGTGVSEHSCLRKTRLCLT